MVKKLRDNNTPLPDFEILPLKNFTGGPMCPATVHKHRRFVILFMIRGAATHAIAGTSYILITKRIQFIGPGEEHQWTGTVPGEGFGIFFSQAFFPFSGKYKELLNSFFYKTESTPAFLDLDTRSAAVVTNLLRRMNEKYLAGDAFSHNIIRSYLNILFFEVVCFYEKLTATKN